MAQGLRKGYDVSDYAALTHLTTTQAAHQLKVCQRTVSDMAERHGLVFAPSRRTYSRDEYAALTHLTIREAADALNVDMVRITSAARRHGLCFALARNRPPAPEPKAEPAAAAGPVPVSMARAPGWTAERDLAIFAALGRYGVLAELARKWNLPLARVQARWHVLRAAR